MDRFDRRKFLEAGSKSAAALLLSRSLLPRWGQAASIVQFLWAGALTPASAQVNAKLYQDSDQVRLLISPSADLSNPIRSGFHRAKLAENNRIVSIYIGGLTPDTQYYYGIESQGVIDTNIQGRLRTPAAGAFSFTFAFSACAETGSSHPVFDKIRSLNPLFFLHMGDMHYQDISVDDRDQYRAAYDAVLGSPAQSALYRQVPLAYIWDDHDYGPNDSDRNAPGRPAACRTYREYVPHYPLPAAGEVAPIYQAFTIGRIRFILTDLRSERTPSSAVDDANKSMMGSAQKQWFKNELLAANGRYAAIIWVCTVPWIGSASAGVDYWAGYSTERQELADFIKYQDIQGLVMLSGDAHMIALDDGTNSDYASGGGAAFPVMHAAALDRPGKAKGGPFSEGIYEGGGQFGLMTVNDTGGDMVAFNLSGRDANDNILVSYDFSLSCCPDSERVFLPLILHNPQ